MDNIFINLLKDNFFINNDVLKNTNLETEMLKLLAIKNKEANIDNYFYECFIFNIEQIFQKTNIDSLYVNFELMDRYLDTSANNADSLIPYISSASTEYNKIIEEHRNNLYTGLNFHKLKKYAGEQVEEDGYGLNLKLKLNRIYNIPFSRENRFLAYSSIYKTLKRECKNNNLIISDDFKNKIEKQKPINIFNKEISWPLVAKTQQSLDFKAEFIKDYYYFLDNVYINKPFAIYELAKFFFDYFNNNSAKEIKDINFVIFKKGSFKDLSLPEVGIIQLKNGQKEVLHKFKAFGSFTEIPEEEFMTTNSSFHTFSKENIFPAFSRLLGISNKRVDPQICLYYNQFEKDFLSLHINNDNYSSSNFKKRI